MPSPQVVSSERPVAAHSPSEAVADDASVLDSAALARLAELDPKGELQLLQRVMSTFVSSAARFTDQLETARASNDRAAIRLVAHTLKSSSGYIGASQLARCCAELEAATGVATRTDLTPEIEAMTAALRVTVAAVLQRLERR